MLRLGLFTILFTISSLLYAVNITQDDQYKLIQPPILTNEEAGKIEVIEFFSYGCPHCATLEPYFAEWEKTKSANIMVTKVPVTFDRPEWKTYARIYYTAEALGVTDKMNSVIFNAIHIKRLNLQDPAVVEKLFVEQGVDATKFKNTYKEDSFTLNTKVNQADNLVKQYKVARIPLITVAGRYETAPSMTGGPQGTKDTLDFLIKKVEEQRAAENAVKP